MRPLTFAWRSVSREPARAILGVAGVAAVGALLFDMLLLSRGLLVSFGELLDSIGFDVRVTATEALPTVGPPIAKAEATAAAIRRLEEIEEVIPIRVGTALALAPDGSELTIYFIGSGTRAGRAWNIVKGADLPERGPSSGEEQDTIPGSGGNLPGIVVTRNLSTALGLEPGSRLRLRAETPGVSSAPPPAEFQVVGIAEFAFESAKDATALTSLSAFDDARAGAERDEADLLLVASRREAGADAAVAAIRRLRPDLHPFSNEQFLSRLDRTDFSYFRQISFVLSSITLFFAFLLVVTLLTVSVNQRFGEVAALRALGFTRRRVVAGLLLESAFLVGGGGLLALPLGAALAYWLDTILRGMPGLPERLHFFVFEPRALLQYVVLLALTGILAAFYPAYLSATLPIAATLREEVVS